MSKISVVQSTPKNIIIELLKAIEEANGYKYIKLRNGRVSLHKSKLSMINGGAGRKIASVTNGKLFYPIVISSGGQIYQDTWENIKKAVK